jgi:hypothetical protein
MIELVQKIEIVRFFLTVVFVATISSEFLPDDSQIRWRLKIVAK